jgi:hypothetical protein
MRAQLINEKFTDESDPISDMGIGFAGINDFKNRLKEVAEIPNKDLKNMNFRDNSQKILELREITAQLVMFYFREKYGLKFKPESGAKYEGSMIGEARLGNFIFKLWWSTTMQSIKLMILSTGPHGQYKESSNCQSMKSLEGNLIKICKELNIKLLNQE